MNLEEVFKPDLSPSNIWEMMKLSLTGLVPGVKRRKSQGRKQQESLPSALSVHHSVQHITAVLDPHAHPVPASIKRSVHSCVIWAGQALFERIHFGALTSQDEIYFWPRAETASEWEARREGKCSSVWKTPRHKTFPQQLQNITQQYSIITQ